MTIARGKEMINQLKFYEIEDQDLGTDTEQEDETQKALMAEQIRKDNKENLERQNISKGVDDEENDEL